MSSTRKGLSAAAAAATVLVLTACGGSGAASTTSRPTSASSTTSAATEPAPALTLGTTYTARDGSVTLAVQQVRSVAYPAKPNGEIDTPPQVGGVLVKGCVVAGDGRFTWDEWTVTDSAGMTYFHFGPTDDQPQPRFPAVTSDPVRRGACATGWVYFDLAKDTSLARATWTSGNDSVTWSAS
jgi:hypothetical protein